jgi:hypothetical protein
VLASAVVRVLFGAYCCVDSSIVTVRQYALHVLAFGFALKVQPYSSRAELLHYILSRVMLHNFTVSAVLFLSATLCIL